MKKKVLETLIIGITAGVLLTGCGSSFPEMTQEEYDQTVQYAVNLLMKYSNNGVERLSSISALEMQKQIEKENREAAKAARDAEAANAMQEGQEETTEPAEETLENTEDIASAGGEGDAQSGDDVDALLDKFGDELDEGMRNSETGETSEGDDAETSLTDQESEETKAETTETDEKQDENTDEKPDEDSLEQQLDNLSQGETELAENPDDSTEPLTTEVDATVDGMRQELVKGLFLTYTGYSVAGSYADEDAVFSITANQGNKLLVLNFQLVNTSGMDVTVDMVKANPHFQVMLNGTNVGYTNVTMLQDDLSSFSGTIPAGERVNMVLIKQMKADKIKTVNSLGLIGDLNGETTNFNLE